MRRLAALVLCAVALASTADAAERVHRVGYLWLGRQGTDEAPIEELRKGLRELGHVEGKTLVIERRYAEGNAERLPALAADLVRAKVDVIRASGTAATRAAREATATIPIVATVGDPVGSGFAASLARPGGNVTGLSLSAGPEMTGKRLELLRDLVPGAKRFAFLWDSTSPPSDAELASLREAATALGMTLLSLAVDGPDGFADAFDRMKAAGVAATMIDATPLFTGERGALVALAAEHRLPTIGGRPDFAAAGGLMTYGMDLAEVFRRAAFFVDRILKGAKPAEMPIEQPTRFVLIVNLKTARTIGIEVPQSVLARADEVIE